MNNIRFVNNRDWKEVEVNGDVVEIPGDWEVEKLKGNIKVINGYAFPKIKMSSKNSVNAFPILKISNIDNNGVIENSGKSQNYYYGDIAGLVIPEFNDLIVGLSGSCGKSGVFKLDKTLLLNQRNIIARSNNKNIQQEYFIYQWNSCLKKHFLSSVRDSAIPNISSKNIEILECIFPEDEKQQTHIAQVLSHQESIIDETRELLQKEKQKFTFLLNNLMSGKYIIKSPYNPF